VHRIDEFTDRAVEVLGHAKHEFMLLSGEARCHVSYDFLERGFQQRTAVKLSPTSPYDACSLSAHHKPQDVSFREQLDRAFIDAHASHSPHESAGSYADATPHANAGHPAGVDLFEEALDTLERCCDDRDAQPASALPGSAARLPQLVLEPWWEDATELFLAALHHGLAVLEGAFSAGGGPAE
jgi:hypothetical protein